MSMETAVGKRMKRQLRAAQPALRQKVMELEILKSKKQNMLAEQTAKDKMVADFMLFTEALEKNDMETAQKFDEKAKKNIILSMMTNGGNNGGFAAGNGGKEA